MATITKDYRILVTNAYGTVVKIIDLLGYDLEIDIARSSLMNEIKKAIATCEAVSQGK